MWRLNSALVPWKKVPQRGQTSPEFDDTIWVDEMEENAVDDKVEELLWQVAWQVVTVLDPKLEEWYWSEDSPDSIKATEDIEDDENEGDDEEDGDENDEGDDENDGEEDDDGDDKETEGGERGTKKAA